MTHQLTSSNRLSEKHYAMLHEASGIKDEIIDARGYRTITDSKELLDLNFSPAQSKNVPGLLLPVCTPDSDNSLCIYRPDLPRVLADRRKRNSDGTYKQRVIKYEVPKGAGMRVDCSPLCLPKLADPSIPLWLTEGQKKADALASHGLCAVAILGVWGFKAKNEFGGVAFLADFDHIAFNGRELRIVFDSDVMSKRAVQQALARITEHLRRKGAHVRHVYLPSMNGKKVGVDDYLLSHSAEELEGLIDAPRPIPNPMPPKLNC